MKPKAAAPILTPIEADNEEASSNATIVPTTATAVRTIMYSLTVSATPALSRSRASR